MEENMKARFYRGPWDGKVRVVPDNRDRILVATTKTKFDYKNDPWEPLVYAEETYSMRMYTITINGRSYTAPAMHPDGSVYFEWDKPRGSRK